MTSAVRGATLLRHTPSVRAGATTVSRPGAPPVVAALCRGRPFTRRGRDFSSPDGVPAASKVPPDANSG